MDVRLKALRQEAPLALEFLEHEQGFAAPQEVDNGLRYERPGLVIDLTVWKWNRETGFATRLSTPRGDGTAASASLDEVYAALELGPAQDIGNSATGRVP